MDLQFWWMLLKILIFLPFILLLIYTSMKFGGNKLQNMQNGRYIKVIERATISKENSLVVVKIGDKGYVMASTNGKLEIISELSKEEIVKIETLRTIPQYNSLKDFYQKSGLKKVSDSPHLKSLYTKLKFKKEGRDE
ncbi:flagellar biosynthetic protein FliO [Clostridium sp. A1-XYC3]|uniref:Flagellar protein n=1 Tax=Clostridium tanneri TaxID=3037988 RepID=A0ABU4JNE1_9CLOT|nr:flagellar biosynthetic protein FliO [Clostridium sp. A1-XYC3]MDW8799652.1 flagellar biosynthetic protein FliO [Clostridium sp. A1-XYC3]